MRLRFWRRRACECARPLIVQGTVDDQDILASFRVVDCSDAGPAHLRALADKADELWPDTVLRHPDLWFDGRWEDPDDWRNDPLLRKVKRDMHARVGAAPFLGGEFGRAMDEPFMPRLEALT